MNLFSEVYTLGIQGIWDQCTLLFKFSYLWLESKHEKYCFYNSNAWCIGVKWVLIAFFYLFVEPVWSELFITPMLSKPHFNVSIFYVRFQEGGMGS